MLLLKLAELEARKEREKDLQYTMLLLKQKKVEEIRNKYSIYNTRCFY